MRTPLCTGYKDKFVLTRNLTTSSHNLDLWKVTFNQISGKYEIKCTKSIKSTYGVESIFMDSERVVVCHYFKSDEIFSIYNTNLDIASRTTFGQSVDTQEPFFIPHSDFATYTNVRSQIYIPKFYQSPFIQMVLF